MIPVDTHGNSLICSQSGNYITVKLKLHKPNLHPSKNYPRKLGVIDTNTKIMTCYRNRERHLHLKKYAYGFNEYLLKNATKFTQILLDEKFGTERHKYLIPVKTILDNGELETYFPQGFEKQIFISFEIIKTLEIKN